MKDCPVGYRATNAFGAFRAASSSAIVLANRFRTRESGIVLRFLGLEATGPGVAAVQILAHDGTVVAGTDFEAASSDEALRWSPIVRTSLPPNETFYCAALLPAGSQWRDGRFEFDADPALVDLGSWIFSGDWKQCGGQRNCAARFRFEIEGKRSANARHEQILNLAADGLTDGQIALELKVTVHTIDFHWRKIRERYGGVGRFELVSEHMKRRFRHEREDLEAERARLDAQLWLSARRAAPIKSWPKP